jgi:hypothetical protein
MMVNRSYDINHIDYCITPDDDEKNKQYVQFISRECYIHGIPLQCSKLDDWHSALRCCIAMEKKLKSNSKFVNGIIMDSKQYPLVKVVKLLIPCVLHLENRANEKIIKCIILHYGFNQFMGSSMSDASAKGSFRSCKTLFKNRYWEP